MSSTPPDCVIIGGGVMGLTVARRLAKEGLRITLLERGRCGGEASWAGAGILSVCNPHRNDAVAFLTARSLAMYPAFCESLLSESGIDTEFSPCGELTLLFSDDAVRCAEADCRAAGGRRVQDGNPTFEMISPEQAIELEPSVHGAKMRGALLCRETAQVRNPRLLRALVTACRLGGVDIRENTRVDGFVLDRGRVVGVRAAAESIKCHHVVICAGAWSAQLGDALGRSIPVRPIKGQMVLLKALEPPLRHVVSRGRTYLVARRDGHVLLGATEEPEAGFNTRNTAAGIASLLQAGLQIAPGVADLPIVTTWAGLRPGTPDDKPILGPVPGFDGLFAATGHYRSGLALAPATAEVAASWICARTYDLDLSICRVGR